MNEETGFYLCYLERNIPMKMASRTGSIMYVVEFWFQLPYSCMLWQVHSTISYDTLVCVVTRLVFFYVIVIVVFLCFFSLPPPLLPKGAWGVACVKDAVGALGHFLCLMEELFWVIILQFGLGIDEDWNVFLKFDNKIIRDLLSSTNWVLPIYL